jgi:nucleotide-binding universal stress UspA family protein
MEKPIVVALAGEEESREALRLAVCAARVLECPLVVAGVAVDVGVMPVSPMTGWVPDPAMPERMQEEVERHLRSLALSVPEDVAYSIDSVIHTSVSAGVEALAERHDAQAVVIGASHHGLLSRVIEGDHALGILRHASCPVIIASQDPADAITATAPKRIGVAWDRGDEAAAALAVAVRVAGLAGGRVNVVHVLEPSGAVLIPPTDLTTIADLDAARHREAEHDIALAVRAIDPGLTVEIDLREGSREGQIEDATKKLDVMIVGSSGKGAIRRVTTGSVSAHLAHHNHCPVVVVPRGVAAGSRA